MDKSLYRKCIKMIKSHDDEIVNLGLVLFLSSFSKAVIERTIPWNTLQYGGNVKTPFYLAKYSQYGNHHNNYLSRYIYVDKEKNIAVTIYNNTLICRLPSVMFINEEITRFKEIIYL